MARPYTPLVVKFDGEQDEQPCLGSDPDHGAIVQNVFLAKDHKLVRRLGSSRWSDGFSSGEFRALKYVLLTRSGAAGFASASDQYLTRTSNASLQTGDIAFTIGAWVKLTTLGADRFIMGKWDRTTLGNREYALYYDATFTGQFVFGVTSAANDIGAVAAATLGTPVVDTWYYITGYHDPSANTINITINGALDTSTGFTFGVAARSTAFQIGRDDTGLMEMNGVVDEAFLTKKLLSAAELAAFYNSGAGIGYSDLTASEKTSLISWWSMDEATGTTRNDSHGTNHLTDTNGVTLVSGKV
jgi:hypothetical protein